MQQIKIIIALFFCLFTTKNMVFATGWPQPKGGGFLKLDLYMIRSRQFFSDDGKIYDINGSRTRLGYYTTSFYGEYGLTNRLTAIGYIPFFVRNTVNEGVGAITGEILQPGLQNNNIGDVDLGLKYHFLRRGAFVFSSTLMFGLPTGDATNPDLLYTGDGEFNQFARLDWGYSSRRWYATGYVGVNNRTKGFSEEFRYYGQFGYWLLPSKLIASVTLSGIESFDNGTPENTGNGLFSNNVEFVSPQLALTYEHQQKWGLTGQIGLATSGRNVLASPGISVGIYRKFP